MNFVAVPKHSKEHGAALVAFPMFTDLLRRGDLTHSEIMVYGVIFATNVASAVFIRDVLHTHLRDVSRRLQKLERLGLVVRTRERRLTRYRLARENPG